jgi:hypothetical protein
VHPDKTCFADRVVYYHKTPKGDIAQRVALVIETHADDPHKACLIYYCRATKAWQEAYNIPFGEARKNDKGEYFVNPEA